MDKVTLAACPPGLFRFNGTLCFKSEYVTTLENPRRYQCDAYVVESGEYFHGGAPNTLARSNLLVEPLATPAPDSEKLREALEAGRTFLAKANSAWACGEPPHRVKTMLDAADAFQTALDRVPGASL